MVARAGAAGTPVDVLVGTISACHGAASLLHLGPAPLERVTPDAGTSGPAGRVPHCVRDGPGYLAWPSVTPRG